MEFHMATVAFGSPAAEATNTIRGNITSVKRQAIQALGSIVNVVRQNGRAEIEAAFGPDAAAFAEDVERIRTLLAGFGMENVPTLPQ